MDEIEMSGIFEEIWNPNFEKYQLSFFFEIPPK